MLRVVHRNGGGLHGALQATKHAIPNAFAPVIPALGSSGSKRGK
jgi:hypothetical protein